jgi:hypothetical protein
VALDYALLLLGVKQFHKLLFIFRQKLELYKV